MFRNEKTRPENDWTEVARRQGRGDEDGSNDLETCSDSSQHGKRGQRTHPQPGGGNRGVVPSEPDSYSSHHFKSRAAIFNC